MLQIPTQKLKEILIKDNLTTEENFDFLANEAKRMDQNIGDILISRNVITTDYFYNVLADYFNVQRANLIGRKIDKGILNILTENLAKQKMVIVFDKEADGSLSVAMEDPSDLGTVEFLRNNLKANIKPYLATQDD